MFLFAKQDFIHRPARLVIPVHWNQISIECCHTRRRPLAVQWFYGTDMQWHINWCRNLYSSALVRVPGYSRKAVWKPLSYGYLKKEKVKENIWLDKDKCALTVSSAGCPWQAGGRQSWAGRAGRGAVARAPHKGPCDAIDSLGFNPAWGVYR